MFFKKKHFKWKHFTSVLCYMCIVFAYKIIKPQKKNQDIMTTRLCGPIFNILFIFEYCILNNNKLLTE